jgi:hypothetical protein
MNAKIEAGSARELNQRESMCPALASWVSAAAINIGRMFHGGASRAAIIAVGIRLASARGVRTFLIGSHVILLVPSKFEIGFYL